MLVPMCEYETHYSEYQAFNELWHREAVAIWKPCGCAGLHPYQAFEEKLRAGWPNLRLGFDRINNRWIIYTWSLEIERVKAGSGLPTISHAKRYLNIVIDCKWAVEVKTAQRGRRMEFHPRMYGDWVLKQLREFDERRLTPDQSWVSDHLRDVADADEAKHQKKIRVEAEDMVADAMTLADRGNPWFMRKQFRQRTALRERVGAT